MNFTASASATATASATANASAYATASSNVSVKDAIQIAEQTAYTTAYNSAVSSLQKTSCKCVTNNTCAVEVNKNYNVQNSFAYFVANLLTAIGVNGWVGLPGSNQLYLYYSLFQLKIPTFLVRSETNGGYMALGSSKMSSIPNNKRQLIALFTDQGPGITQAVNPMASATLEGYPLINFSIYNVDSNVHNREVQDVDPFTVVGGISKAYYLITMEDINNKSVVEKLYDAIKKGFSYPRGAINIIFGFNTITADASELNMNINIYKNLFNDMFVSDNGLQLKSEIRSVQPFTGLFDLNWNNTREIFLEENQQNIISPNDYQTFFGDILQPAKRPLFIIGNGCYEFIFELIDFCKKIKCPYLFTLPMATYANKDDPYSAIRMGHTATFTGNNIAYMADVIILVGTSFNNYTLVQFGNPFQPNAIRVCINPYPEIYDTSSLINKYVIDFMQNIITTLNTDNLQPNDDRGEWFETIRELKMIGDEKNKIFYNPNPNNSPLLVGDIFKVIQDNVDEYLSIHNNKVYVVCDSGNSQPFTGSFFTCKNKNYNIVTFPKFATIGLGVGTIIGLAYYYPNDIFILIAGDAASLWSVNDVITIKEMNIKNIIIIVSENYGVGLINDEGEFGYDRSLEFGNGYKYYPNWKQLYCGMLLKTEVAKNANEFKLYFENAMNNLFTECSCIVTFIPYNLTYSPFCKLNTNLTDQIYIVPDSNNPIDICRYSK
jgi:thiamine pyrophosphate-dependent acetolactate synthase large subunit-like protein